jgi:dTDP-4-amino-4,6-dideoxygalactose transaminase
MLKDKKSSWPSFTKEEIDSVSKVLRSGKVNYWTGKECRLFEEEFCTFSNCSYSIAVSNGTVAIDLALKALNIGKGDEVIVTSRTFLASVSCIINAGAKPVFVDISKNSQNITPENINSAITDKTKAILCVHLAGWPCEMDEMLFLVKKHSLYLIEDCAQAHGAAYKGKSVGSFGDIGCWSFCQDKIMTTGGEGGMVTTNNKLLWKKMWSYKDHGKSYDAVYSKNHPPGFRWLHESFGTNWRMTEMQAAIGRIQLSYMSEWTEKRNSNQNTIWETASKIKGLRVPQFSCYSCNKCNRLNKCTHAAYKCYLFIEPKELKNDWTRDKIISHINERGVQCFSGSCSEVYLEKAFDNTNLRPSKRLSNAKELGETSLMFLVHPTLSTNELNLTCKVLRNVMQKATK